MSITTRLQQATRSLSPLQRITLILEAVRDGREPDQDLHSIEDPQQRTAFRRYIALLYTSNVALGARCEALTLVSQDLELAADQVRLLSQAAAVLEEEHGLPPPRRARDWRRTGRMEVNEFLRSLAKEVREAFVAALALRWQELRAVELLWQELSEEFGGADPVDPQFRDKAKTASARLQALAREFNATSRLMDPPEAVAAEARRAVDEAFDRLEPLL